MLLKDFVRDGIVRLSELYPEREARNIVLLLCEEELGIESYTYIVEPDRAIPAKNLSLLEADMNRLAEGEPLQYVTGKADFYGFRFNVSKSVLIPRPETELMCREAIRHAARVQRMRSSYGKNAKPVSVLDLCTGSGCIAWTIALSVPGCMVKGVDISWEALEVAGKQEFSSLLKKVKAVPPSFMHMDVLDAAQDIDMGGPYDMIVGNPPYVRNSEKALMRKNVLDFEPEIALFVPDEDPLLFYRAISEWSVRLLSDDGIGLCEVNESLAAEVSGVFGNRGYVSDIMKDLSGKDRFIIYHK